MGKKIDSFVLTAALALAFYLYFFYAFENQIGAIILSLISCYVLRRCLNAIVSRVCACPGMQKRRMRKNAGSIVMKLACMPDEEAKEDIRRLLHLCYDADYCMELVQTHPSLHLSSRDVFKIWKANQGLDYLVICATCKADNECCTLAASLESPRVALLDADALEQMLAEHPGKINCCEPHKTQRKLQLRRILQLIINRKNAPKNLLLACSMLAIYLFSANILYLLAALILLAVSLLSLRAHPRPAKLF